MYFNKTTLLYLNLVVAFFKYAKSAPSSSKNQINDYSESLRLDQSVEKSLEHFLNLYYEKYLKNKVELELINYIKSSGNVLEEEEENIYDRMQGDQPMTENHIPENSTSERNISDSEYFRTMRNRYRDTELDDRTKDNWLQFLKDKVLKEVGRGNLTVVKTGETKMATLNISEIFPNLINISAIINDQIAEKIRSFYPSCEIPSNTDQDLWKEDNYMNLYFNFDYTSDDKNNNIATATLRLYRLPSENATLTKPGDCDNVTSADEEKLLRVSVYWYTKSLKKRRVKRRLSDSKVVSDTSKWVELSVKPAAKAWSKGRNLGLAVLVEDQEGNKLRADKLFKGATCMVGSSTPKPIPTIIIDAARKTNEFNRNRLLGIHERNSTASLYSDIHLLPTVDICTVEYPENYTELPHMTNACNLKRLHEQSQKLAEKERLERLATLPDILVPSTRHIRHQRQYLANKMNNGNDGMGLNDPRSNMVGSKIVMTNEELQNFNLSHFNLTMINR